MRGILFKSLYALALGTLLPPEALLPGGGAQSAPALRVAIQQRQEIRMRQANWSLDPTVPAAMNVCFSEPRRPGA